ncbi:MAG: 50S ribosomal protein L32 [Clostridia bacterium]|nr:50S ribosomal protein L32 [Clostridia bacterium]
MAVPKSKVSKQRGNKRFSANSKATSANLTACPQCGELKATHRVCAKCGYYDGELIVEKKEKKND